MNSPYHIAPIVSDEVSTNNRPGSGQKKDEHETDEKVEITNNNNQEKINGQAIDKNWIRSDLEDKTDRIDNTVHAEPSTNSTNSEYGCFIRIAGY